MLVLAACGSSDEDEAQKQTGDSSSTEETATTNELQISASNFKFDQDEYTVNAGEEVKLTLVNEEGMHGIAIDGIDVNIKGDGETPFTPDKPGEYTIYCSVPCGAGHADMKSTLVVS